MKITKIIREMIFGYRVSSETYVKHLKKIGVEVGEDVVIYRPMNTTIDIQNPHLISIGNHVMITGPVTILTHDYSWSVLKRKYGDIVGNQKKTVIGDNVFIGWGSTILAGSQIGSNSIIGANSVISGKLEENAVYAGNPVHKIMSLEEYYIKRKEKQLTEAIDFVKSYKFKSGKLPEMGELDEYFYLFFNPNDAKQVKTYEHQLKLVDSYEKSIEKAKILKPIFASYEEFINYCEEEMRRE